MRVQEYWAKQTGQARCVAVLKEWERNNEGELGGYVYGHAQEADGCECWSSQPDKRQVQSDADGRFFITERGTKYALCDCKGDEEDYTVECKCTRLAMQLRSIARVMQPRANEAGLRGS